MKISADLSKDFSRVETSLSTDIASLGLWDSQGMQWVSSEEVESTDFATFFQSSNPKTAGHIIAAQTGTDGNFRVILYLNGDLSEADKKLVYKAQKAIHLTVTDKLLIGSPEGVGYQDESRISRNLVDVLVLPPGDYVVDAYSLLIRDAEGKPRYMQFAFCIFLKSEYPQPDVQPRNIGQILPLRYP